MVRAHRRLWQGVPAVEGVSPGFVVEPPGFAIPAPKPGAAMVSIATQKDHRPCLFFMMAPVPINNPLAR